MTDYEKGFRDAQREIALRYYHCYLEDAWTDLPRKDAAKVIGLSEDEFASMLKKALKEEQEKEVASCLAESDSLEEKIIRLYIEGYTWLFIENTLHVTLEKIYDVLNNEQRYEYYEAIYHKLKAKKEKTKQENKFCRNYALGVAIGEEKSVWKLAHVIHDAGGTNELISEALDRTVEDVERLLSQKKEEDIEAWVEAHWDHPGDEDEE